MLALPSPRRPPAEPEIGAIVSAFESETAAVILRTSPRSERTILYAVAAMIAVALALMSVTKLERVVTSTGRIVPVAGSFYVEPYDKAIVRNIRVQPGDVVRKGEVLATLDPTFAAADLAQLRQKAASAAALVARLEAERMGKPYSGGGDSYGMLQESIWRQRQAEYRAGIADFDARIRSDEAIIAKARQDAAVFKKRLKLAGAVETMKSTLERQGYESRLNMLAATDVRLDIGRQLAESERQIEQSRHDADSLRAQRAVYIEHWLDDLNTQLVAAHNSLDEAQQQLAKARKVHQLIDLVAPRDAIVLKIGRSSVGSVVNPGPNMPGSDPLFTLMPIDGPLEAVVNVSSEDIGFIQPGQPVAIKLDAYPFIRHGTAGGTVKTVSDGSFTLDENQQPVAPYFKVWVAITDVHLHNVPANFRLVPGMTLGADIKVGHRTLMSYLIDGALRTGSEAMREP
ncbi:MAG TPA: HlyD family type I secretion periplasmic adaptor subunit [Stellaceae bacterium]|nr:HlyD family type I secretion periplasmic adaptor subunit [Stellaceae bacterium]